MNPNTGLVRPLGNTRELGVQYLIAYCFAPARSLLMKAVTCLLSIMMMGSAFAEDTPTTPIDEGLDKGGPQGT